MWIIIFMYFVRQCTMCDGEVTVDACVRVRRMDGFVSDRPQAPRQRPPNDDSAVHA